MTGYAKGAKFEREVKKALESKGYVVIRSAGSRGPADLIGMQKIAGRTTALAVACRSDGRISNREWEKLEELGEKSGATPLLAKRGDYGIFLYDFKVPQPWAVL